jgi:phosphoenolpyruvate-protein phosphotransferase (PTS system enzyme I)
VTFSCCGIGISTAHSIAVGKVHRLQQGVLHIQPRFIIPGNVNNEIQRFKNAIDLAQNELVSIKEQLPDSTAPDIVDFINTHLLMLEDQALCQAVEELIENKLASAEWALQTRRNELVKLFDEMEDAYLRTRKDDLDHVINRVQKKLLNITEDLAQESLEGKVIVARDLSPSDTILMRHQGIVGFITEYGGPMSHTAILARSLNIPAIIGIRFATELFEQGETIVVDSRYSTAIASPDQRLLDQVAERLQQELGQEKTLQALISIPSFSTDGQAFQLMSNIELPEDIEASINNGACAIGLYRTEFLYMNRRTMPDEEEHYSTYCEIIEKLNGLPLTIRTLDLGADKTTSYELPASSNPALGLRAIRLCLKETELFRTQLRAILRASAKGPVRLLIPMLTNVREVEQALKLIENIKQELRLDGIGFDSEIPVGGMIEVPAAALDAQSFARKLDFLSIGTNDLIQYTLAIDRVDDEVNYLYDPLHPAVIKLIKHIINAAQAQSIPVGMCGEMAGDPRLLGLLAGLGLREFSMQPNSILQAKQTLIGTDFNNCSRLTDELLDCFELGDNDLIVDNLFKIIH